MEFFRRSLSRIMLCCMGMLASCATPRTIATFQTESGTVSLRQSSGSGAYFVGVSPHTVLPLGGYVTARIESMWSTPHGNLAILSGSTTDCALHYSLIVMTTETAKLEPIGDCGGTYSFTQRDGVFAITQSDTRERKSWLFKDGLLQGPFIQPLSVTRRPLRKKMERPNEQSADPMALPSVSAPVGDEVIPTPVKKSSRS